MPEQTPDVNLQHTVGENTIAASLFQNGTAQVGGMVTSITLVGQAFTNLNMHSAAAPLAAFVFATLLAIYQVSILQKAPRRSCFILVPIATLILFALSYAGNNSLAPAPETASLQQELELTKKELDILQSQVDISDKLIALLEQNLEPATEDNGNSQTGLTPVPGLAQIFLDGLIRPVMAQDTAVLEAKSQQQQKQELSKALKEYQAKQQKLLQEQRHLEQQRRKIQLQPPSSPGWRSWR